MAAAEVKAPSPYLLCGSLESGHGEICLPGVLMAKGAFARMPFYGQDCNQKLLAFARQLVCLNGDSLICNDIGMHLFPSEGQTLAPRAIANRTICLNVPFD